MLQEQGERDAGERPDHTAQQQLQRLPWPRRSQRNLRGVHDRNIRGVERARDLRFLEASREGRVHLAARLRLPAEQVVLAHPAFELGREAPLLVHQLLELGLVLASGMVFGADPADDLLRLFPKLGADLGDVLGQSLHPGIIGLEDLTELSILALQRGRLLLELGDERVLQHGGDRARLSIAARLLERALLRDALRPRLEQRVGQDPQLLVDQGLGLAESVGADELDVVLLEELGELRLGDFQLLSRFLLLLGEEGCGGSGCLGLLTSMLAHELVHERVGDCRRERRLVTPERHLDEARVAEHIDLQPVEKGGRQLTAPAADLLKVGMMVEAQKIDDPVGESATLEQPLEGLKLSLRQLAVLSDDLVELEHPRLFAVHSKKRGGREHWPGEETPGERCQHAEQEHGDNGPAMTGDRPPVRRSRWLPAGRYGAIMFHIEQERPCRSISDRWPAAVSSKAQNPYAAPRPPLKKSRNPKKTALP